MNKLRVALIPSVLVLAALACDLPGRGVVSPASGIDAVQTSVAATVAAVESAPEEEILAEPEDSPVFEDFADQVDGAVRRGDSDFFAARAGDEVQCTGLEEPPLEGTEQMPHPCLGQPAGVALRVIESREAESGFGGLLTNDEYAEILGEWFGGAVPEQADDFGDGAPALHAIVTWHSDSPLASVSWGAVLTGIVRLEGMEAPVRSARVLGFEFVDGRWWLTGELVAWLFEWSPEAAEIWLSGGCESCYDEWEAWTGSSR